jgi:serine/threonine-protein kinase HipA
MNKAIHQRPSVLEVWLNQTFAGTITNLPYDRNLFVFDEQYSEDKQRPILSLSFYDANSQLMAAPEEAQTKVPAFFSNLLPEGRLREFVAERGGIKPVREFFMLWLLGTDLPGAVIIRDSEARPLPPSSQIKSNARAQADSQILRFSLAGVQLKFSAIGSPDRQLTIPAEGRDGSWIVKLPSARYDKLPENEYSMLKLAAEAGLEVAEAGLMATNEIAGLPSEMHRETANSLYVRRFDRTPEGGRIHIEDFNQVYAQFPEAKYKNYSYTNMAADIWRVIGEDGVREFVRRLIFNAAIGNADMHLKNWSLIYRPGQAAAMAPGYDFVATIRYVEDRKMALSMAKEKDTRYLNEDLLTKFAAKARIPTRLILEVAHQTAEQTVAAWSRLARELPLDEQTREAIHEQLRYVPLTRQFVTDDKAPRSLRKSSRRSKKTSAFS